MSDNQVEPPRAWRERISDLLTAIQQDLRKVAGARSSVGENNRPVTLSTAAAWLIPSVSALFLVIGYVVQSAQDSLLGFPSDVDFPNGYLIDSANFIRDSIYLLLERAQTGFSNSGLLHHPILLSFAVLVAIATRLLSSAPSRWAAVALRAAQLLLLVLLVSKFLTLDAPLLRVENLLSTPSSSVVGQEDAYWSLLTLKDARTLARNHFFVRPGSQATGLERFVGSRSADIFDQIVCSRLSPAVSGHIDRFATSKLCGDQNAEIDLREDLQDEVLANVVVLILLGVDLVILTRMPRRSALTGLACLFVGLACFAAPYAYGKLIKSTDFEFGIVRPTDILVAKLAAPDVAIIAPKRTTFDAALLSSRSDGIKFLSLRTAPCSVPPGGNGPNTTQRLSLSRVSTDQILSFEEIQTQDVISMAAGEGRQCGDTGGPLP